MGTKRTVWNATGARRRSLLRGAVRGSARILAVAAVLGVCLAPFASGMDGVRPEGRWVATGGDGCPEGLLCVVWDFTGAGENRVGREILCCIPAEMVGSSDLGACERFRD